MKKSDLFLMALANLKNRKTRTRLTVIGVVIGTCAIVIMVSIGIGIDKMVTAQYAADSSLNKITVYSSYDDEGKKTLPFDDSAVEYLKTVSDVEMVLPKLTVSECATVVRGKFRTQWCDIVGIDFSLMERAGYECTEGSFQSADRNTVFFGETTVTNFVDKQGNSVKYKYDEDFKLTECEVDAMNDTFFIAPVLNSEDGSPADTSSLNKRIRVGGVLKRSYSVDYLTDSGIFIDMKLAKELIEKYNELNSGAKYNAEYSEILVFVNDMQNVEAVTDRLQEVGFSCYSDMEELEYTKKVMLVVQLVLGAIGAISMFVAAFGISNTMVMSVFERTKEIGIMKVLGCNLSDIKNMFLYEAGIIGFLGGSIGMAISYIISIAANIIARAVVNSMGSEDLELVCVSSIPLWLCIAGILFAVIVGVIAGRRPANRSVKVSALTAIHNE